MWEHLSRKFKKPPISPKEDPLAGSIPLKKPPPEYIHYALDQLINLETLHQAWPYGYETLVKFGGSISDARTQSELEAKIAGYDEWDNVAHTLETALRTNAIRVQDLGNRISYDHENVISYVMALAAYFSESVQRRILTQVMEKDSQCSFLFK